MRSFTFYALHFAYFSVPRTILRVAACAGHCVVDIVRVCHEHDNRGCARLMAPRRVYLPESRAQTTSLQQPHQSSCHTPSHPRRRHAGDIVRDEFLFIDAVLDKLVKLNQHANLRLHADIDFQCDFVSIGDFEPHEQQQRDWQSVEHEQFHGVGDADIELQQHAIRHIICHLHRQHYFDKLDHGIAISHGNILRDQQW